MSHEPKLQLYSEAHYVGDRPEIPAIHGQRVAILARSLGDDGEWTYTVSANKTSAPMRCFESELIPADPIPFISDAEYMEDIVAETARLRFSVVFDGLRQLLTERGYDPLKCLLISCEQGLDVAITLVLPDATIVGADFREDSETRQATRFEVWEALDYSDREIELCREVLAGDTHEFEENVRRYFAAHLAASDEPLPPKVFGVLKSKIFDDGRDVQQ